MSTTSPSGERERQFAEFLKAFEAEFAPLDAELALATWETNIRHSPEHEATSARLETHLKTILSRKEAYTTLSQLREGGPLADPLLDRQLVLLHHAHRGQQLSASMIERQVQLAKSLESRFNQFRAQLDGRSVSDNELVDVLRNSTDNAER
ncbi:MAG: hypothetical protein K8R56_08775, partial [Candidatus Eisenbacteria bacterium]|nr:hypothetical protein [Candidatus Eisenbacteria bacterium]